MKPRTLEELIDLDDPAWPIVRSWIDEAHNRVEVLPPDLAVRDQALLSSQVATCSPLGAVIYETGGLLVDHGWVRVLGSGSARLPRAIHEWNIGRTSRGTGAAPGFYLIADDAAGGFFALNGGALGETLGDVYYHAPDSLAWEPMGMFYSAFLRWLFSPNLGEWSADLRWSGWREEVEDLPGDRAILFHPFLFTREGSLESSERRPVPIGELFALYVDGEPASGGRSSETTSREDSE
jgi:hypothetical protein